MGKERDQDVKVFLPFLQRRRTKGDARAYAVKLTDEGRRLLRVAKRVDERLLAALPAGKRQTLIGASTNEPLSGRTASASAWVTRLQTRSRTTISHPSPRACAGR